MNTKISERRNAMNVSVRLTATQLDKLIELFDEHFVDAVRTGESAKDMAYVCEMVDVYNKLKKTQTKAAVGTEDGENIPE